MQGPARPMQSPTAIAFRAVVMLVILISVPAIALFGKDLPDVIKGLIEGRKLVLGPPRSPDSNWPAATSPRPAPPAWDSSGPYRASQTPAPPDPSTRTAEPSAPAMSPQNPPAAVPALTAGPPTDAPLAASSQPPAYGAPPQSSAPYQPSTAPAPSAHWQTVPATGPQDAVGTVSQPSDGGRRVSEEIAQASPAGDALDPFAGPPAGGPSPDSEQFRWAERRLRELGATHYMLETWGPQNNRYRFVCQMAIGGSEGANRYFQAIDDDPWRAMEGVLKQVEAWRLQASQ